MHLFSVFPNTPLIYHFGYLDHLMKNLLKIEELALFAMSIYLFGLLEMAWWWYPALILLPDIGMIGYLASTRTGAITYNLFHHRAVAISVLTTGYLLSNEWLTLAGIILFGHISMDRIFGYGLKYTDDFKNTHLGRIGAPAK